MLGKTTPWRASKLGPPEELVPIALLVQLNRHVPELVGSPCQAPAHGSIEPRLEVFRFRTVTRPVSVPPFPSLIV
jgi:hypothetical protein